MVRMPDILNRRDAYLDRHELLVGIPAQTCPASRCVAIPPQRFAEHKQRTLLCLQAVLSGSVNLASDPPRSRAGRNAGVWSVIPAPLPREIVLAAQCPTSSFKSRTPTPLQWRLHSTQTLAVSSFAATQPSRQPTRGTSNALLPTN